jgi:very-short-patch-repair endonuclease
VDDRRRNCRIPGIVWLVEIREVMERFGGLATRASLIRATSRADVDRALAEDVVLASGKGRYVLPEVARAAALAHGMNGILCLTDAALHHGWETKSVPERPHVMFPRKRNVKPEWREQVVLHRGDLSPDDVSGGIATSRELTLLQCLRQLPDDEALVIADSALRHGEQATLRRVLASVRGAGRAKVRRIGQAARAEAANVFESSLRAISHQVSGLSLEPQVVISSQHCWARPDLVDVRLRIVVEADSFEWHGSRAALRKDARRYDLLVADGWLVLRFSWEDVMHDPDFVRGILQRVVALVGARSDVPAA